MTQNSPQDENRQDERHVPIDDDRVFDLLVDGELDEPRRRSLLSGLDDKPGGWRRCALAFLEAQSWRREMPSLALEPAAPPVAKATASRRSRGSDRARTLLGMAASFFLAVGLTSLMRDMQRGAPDMGSGGANIAGIGGGGGGGTSSQPRAVFGMPERLEVVRLVGRDAQGRPVVTVLPAFPQDRLDPDYIQNPPSAVPAEVTESLRRAGHDVRPTRRLVPIQLQDGRRVVFPVDQIDVRYVEYQ